MALNSFLIVILFILLPVICENNEENLKVEVLSIPSDICDRKATNGDQISMHYIGTLEKTGKKFDASYDRNQPFTFILGAGQVIPGWEKGIPGMCVGEKRKLTLPPSLAYGDRGFGDIIPARSTLVFEIELMAINDNSDGNSVPDVEESLTKEEFDNYIDESQAHDHHDHDHHDHDHHDHDHDHHDHDHDHHDHQNSFEELDLNNDGGLTSEEMSTYIKKFQEAASNLDDIEMPSNDESIETIVSEIFQEDDKNKDGVISKDEYMHASLNEDFNNDHAKEEL